MHTFNQIGAKMLAPGGTSATSLTGFMQHHLLTWLDHPLCYLCDTPSTIYHTTVVPSVIYTILVNVTFSIRPNEAMVLEW